MVLSSDARPVTFDREGEPITVARWAVLMGDRNYVRVAWTRLVDLLPPYTDMVVSTCWLGWATMRADGTPLIFETLMQPGSGPGLGELFNDRFFRHASEQEALRDHERTVAILSRFMSKPRVTAPPRSGRRRDHKPHAGMAPRARAEALAASRAVQDGEALIRGRNGKPDVQLGWTYRDGQSLVVEQITRSTVSPVPVLPRGRGRHRRG